MDRAVESFFAIFAGIVGVAIVAILISQKSNTTGVLQAFGSAFGNALNVAVSPVTGASIQGNLSYPSSSGAVPFTGYNWGNFPGLGS